ncbi:MAG: tetratricopeptide repeat protein, partial [Prevotellaceae bacterium]|nr:tetratricopeptide repeat protein [Prevotellaceae bacterium]
LKYATYSAETAALATYWKGEAAFREGGFTLAQKLFSEFVLSAGVSHTDEYRVAHYSLAYSLFQQEKYAEAQSWFRKYAAFSADKPSAMLCDAYNRIGDCNFMQSAYGEAILAYATVIKIGLSDADYAAFQSGLCYGLEGSQDKKIELMNAVINARPASPYADNALYEKGRCYVQMQEYEQAVNVYAELLSKFQQSTFYAKTLIELGLICVNKADNKQALDYYKRVVKDFSGTAEARSALLGIKNIYIEMEDVDGYAKYVAGIKNVGQVNASERDSMTFAIAENQYMANDCEKATPSLKKYLQEFSVGAFVVDANFYMADCYYRAGKLEEAVLHFDYVLNSPKSSYTEPSLLGAARASFELGENEKAAIFYERLAQAASTKATVVEALVGKMRADFLAKNDTAVLTDVAIVLNIDNLSPELSTEAHFKRAKAQEHLGDTAKAHEDYMLVSKNAKTKEGAEAQYKIIEYLFSKNDLDKAEAAVLEFSKSGTPHQYWLAKSFITLGDVYVKRNDAFQAKATYESIADGYSESNDGIVAEVTAKIQQLTASESAKEASAEQQSNEQITITGTR